MKFIRDIQQKSLCQIEKSHYIGFKKKENMENKTQSKEKQYVSEISFRNWVKSINI